MLLFRRLAFSGGPGRSCDGSAVGGNGISGCRRRLFHTTEVGLCEFSSTYCSMGSLTIRGGSRDLSLSLGGRTLVLRPQCMLPLEGGYAFPNSFTPLRPVATGRLYASNPRESFLPTAPLTSISSATANSFTQTPALPSLHLRQPTHLLKAKELHFKISKTEPVYSAMKYNTKPVTDNTTITFKGKRPVF